MASNKKKSSFAKRITRYAKNALISGIKGIYHDAKDSAKTKHDIDMDINNIYKNAWTDVLKENKREEDKLSLSELKSLMEDAKKQVIDALGNTDSAKQVEDKLLGLDFDDLDLDDTLEDMGVESFDELFKNAIEKVSDIKKPETTTLRKTKEEMISLAMLFVCNYINDDSLNEFIQDKRDMIKSMITSKGMDESLPVDNVTSNGNSEKSFDNTMNTIDEFKNNEVVVKDARSGMVVTGSMEEDALNNFKEENTDFRRYVITKSFELTNILKDLNNKIAKDSDAESIYSTFVCYVHKIIDLYYNSKGITTSADELIYERCYQIKSLINHGFDHGSALHIFGIFYLDLIDESDRRMISNIIVNSINFEKED